MNENDRVASLDAGADDTKVCCNSVERSDCCTAAPKCCTIQSPLPNPCADPCKKMDFTPPRRSSKCCKQQKSPYFDTCENTKCSYDDFCGPHKDCENIDLCSCEDQYTSIKIKCLCVKFNGLQDTCKHTSCITKTGCLENPYPTCLAAQKWKCEYLCKKSKKLCNEC